MIDSKWPTQTGLESPSPFRTALRLPGKVAIETGLGRHPDPSPGSPSAQVPQRRQMEAVPQARSNPERRLHLITLRRPSLNATLTRQSDGTTPEKIEIPVSSVSRGSSTDLSSSFNSLGVTLLEPHSCWQLAVTCDILIQGLICVSCSSFLHCGPSRDPISHWLTFKVFSWRTNTAFVWLI